MAKGKKKGGKKDTAEEDTSGTKSVSEEQPSTSSQPPAEPADDDDGLGLGLGGGRKKKDKKQKAAQVLPAQVPAQPVEAPTPAPAPAPPPEKNVEEVTEEVDGLGLGGSKKRNPRKKKKGGGAAGGDSQQPAAAVPPTQFPSVPTAIPPAQFPPMPTAVPPAQFPPMPTAVPPAQFPPMGAAVPPAQFPPMGAAVPPAQFTPMATAAPPAQYPPMATAVPPAQYPPMATAVPPAQFPPMVAPGQSAPGAGGWGQPVQQFAPSPSVSQASWGQPAPVSGGRGRGAGASRGRGRGQAGSELPPPRQGPPAESRPGPPVQHIPDMPVQPAARPIPHDAVLCRYKVPLKIPGGGVVTSRQINLLTNYLTMKIQPLKITRYDVSFKPDKPKKLIPMAYQMVKKKYYPNDVIAFDQMKNCYCLRPLKNVPPNDRFTTTVDVEDQNGRVLKFEVSFKETGVVDLGKILNYMGGGTSLNPPTEEIQCIDVILRQGTLEAYTKAGRQFFQRPDRPIDLGDGLEMWTGLFQSAIFTSRPFINIDVAHKGFPRQQRLIDAFVKDFRLDPNNCVERQRGREVEAFQTFLKGLRLVTTLVGSAESAGQKREYICNGLVDPPSRMKFLKTDQATGKDKQITVAEYFAKEKNYRIQYPNLNCVWVGPKDRNVYYPMELLEVAYGQALNKQLNENQLSKMVREAATPPDERMRKIKQVITHMNYPQNAQFKKFGLEISDQFFPVKAKVLDAPNLQVGEGRIMPRKGVWQANKLLKPEALQSWGFIAIEVDSRYCDFQNIISLLKNTGMTMGMAVSEPKLCLFNAKMQELHNILFTALEKEIKFLFVIVATRGRDYYHKVKQLAEREVGILTQCIKELTASRKMNAMTARNILLKVNSKLMGINQALDSCSMPRCLKDGGVMIVGADVTHPSPDQTSIPSIAAVTASIDPKCYMYNIELSIQTPKKEMIVEFEDMMVDHLKIYMKNNKNYLPRKIFVFRDGVSEGQFAQVMNSELQAVHNAYQRMAGSGKKPEILFLLVQKRHHTRFFLPTNSKFNVEPGTVVDTDIVHASELDFYLVSHAAIKGTARPTRYHAVCNDGRIPDSEVEQLTYYLCHLYSRCMRAVSYPTPTYYAHLACLRARSLTFGERFDNKELEKKPKRLRVLDKMLQQSRMFFV